MSFRIALPLSFLASFALSLVAGAENYFPGTNYSPAIPTLESVVGHENGTRITDPRETRAYFDALERANPERIKVVAYAESWEGRELFYVVIASQKNMSRLNDIKTAMQSLADPRITGHEEAKQIIASMPGVVWLTYGVHGNEISSTDAAMAIAYHLLAAEDDAVVEKVLAETVVLIDPMQNPDGRARFVHNFEIAEGLEVDADRLAAEHQEPWPGGRTNHYLFDMNRDWFALTQPESRGRVRVFQEWFPLAVIDAHEMSGDSSYYFGPPAEPHNPLMTDMQIERMHEFGEQNARWFDDFGFDYYTREIFDAFYPGYGDMWPTLHGAIASTYEQSSTRGLLWRRADGEVMTYWDTVQGHAVTSLATAETLANNRQALMQEFYDYRRTAVEEGRGSATRAYIVPKQKNAAGVRKLIGNLSAQGIDAQMAGVNFKACKKSYEAGSYIIDAAQPSGRLIASLLNADTPIPQAFMREQERRRNKGLPHQLYDVTAWSLPLMYGLDVETCKTLPRVESDATAAGPATMGKDAVAYVVPWQDVSSVRFLVAALREGLAVKSSDKAIVLGERTVPPGSLILQRSKNVDGLSAIVERLAREHGSEVLSRDESWVTGGAHFGSDNVLPVKPLRIALAWDEGTSSYSAGNTRFVLERQMGHPVTIIRTLTLARADLSKFDVVILPEQNWIGYEAMLGAAGARNLSGYVKRGGVLIGLGSAMRYLSTPDHGLSSLRRELAVADNENGAGGKDDKAQVKGQIISDDQSYQNWVDAYDSSPDTMPGALVKASGDEDHWLTSGLGDMHVLVTGRDIYRPLRGNQGRNVAHFAGPKDLLASGYIWKENQEQLAYKPFVTVENKGRGLIIGFTASPTTRAYLDGLNMIFANAVLRGPSHAYVLH